MAVCLVAVSACTEVLEGPRVVTYSPDRFYVRHVPWRDSSASIDALASAICERVGKEPMLERTQQYAPIDVRYATYSCVERASKQQSAGVSAAMARNSLPDSHYLSTTEAAEAGDR
jgi:hypothetical protein